MLDTPQEITQNMPLVMSNIVSRDFFLGFLDG